MLFADEVVGAGEDVYGFCADVAGPGHGGGGVEEYVWPVFGDGDGGGVFGVVMVGGVGCLELHHGGGGVATRYRYSRAWRGGLVSVGGVK